VERSKSASHLAALMRAERPRVIITTMQKFIKLEKVGRIPLEVTKKANR
jgi:type I site-specific restriction-modification system R (restriction) subunit